MRTYRLSHRISHAYVDMVGELKVSGLLGLLEQAAIEASADAGYEAERYQREGRVWIIRRTTLERLQPVGGSDRLDVVTQITDVRRARSLRSYQVHSAGKEVARAVTDWVYCDMASGRPARIGADVVDALTGGEKPPMLERPADLPESGELAPVVLSVDVRPSHLDHITHVNNGVYADFIEDGAFALFQNAGRPLDQMLAERGAMGLRRLDIEYHADARAGDSLVVSTWINGAMLPSESVPAEAHLVHMIRRSNGDELVRATTSWAWRQRSSVLGHRPTVA